MKGARKQLQEAKAEFQSVYNELEEQDEGKMRVRSKQVTPAANRKVASSELVGNPRWRDNDEFNLDCITLE